MKILINTPFITSPAGVSNHYLGLKPYFSYKVQYNEYYTSYYLRRKIQGKWLPMIVFPLVFLYNYLKFAFLIIKHKRPILLLNPSFGRTALKRDVQFLKLAKLINCKVVIFIHGWDKVYLAQVLERKEHFSGSWMKADAFFVLATEFKNYLHQLNIKAPIFLTTTKVNDQLVENLSEKTINGIETILFLARVERAKGIFTAIDSFDILRKKYPDLKMQVVGNGNALEEAKRYASNKLLTNIHFTGPLFGNDLKQAFLNADLYVLPTHGEGMPTSVLEAMAFGLPVITRPVGGLVDFFENDKMGYMIESFDASDYADKIDMLINNLNKANEISSYNMQYAKEKFMASKVANELESILLEI